MALSNEEKAARKIAAIMDSVSLNPAMVAFAIENEADLRQQEALFQLTLCLMKCWSQSDILSTHYGPTKEDVERKALSNLAVEAVERKGYTIW